MNKNKKIINSFVDLLGSIEFSIEQILALVFVSNSNVSVTYAELGSKLSMSQYDTKGVLNQLLGKTRTRTVLIEFTFDKVTYLKTTDFGEELVEQLLNTQPLSFSDITETKIAIEKGLTKLGVEPTQNGFNEVSDLLNKHLNIETFVSLDIVDEDNKTNSHNIGYAKSFFFRAESEMKTPRREFQSKSNSEQLVLILKRLLHSQSKIEAIELLSLHLDRMELEEKSREYIADIIGFESCAGIRFHEVFLHQGENAYFAERAISLVIQLQEKYKSLKV